MRTLFLLALALLAFMLFKGHLSSLSIFDSGGSEPLTKNELAVPAGASQAPAPATEVEAPGDQPQAKSEWQSDRTVFQRTDPQDARQPEVAAGSFGTEAPASKSEPEPAPTEARVESPARKGSKANSTPDAQPMAEAKPEQSGELEAELKSREKAEEILASMKEQEMDRAATEAERQASWERAMVILDEALDIWGIGPVQMDDPQPEPAAVEQSQDIQSLITGTALKQGVDPALALAVCHVESNFDPKARSHKGAVGLFQVMPSTALEHFGVEEAKLVDPQVNADVGLCYLKQLLDRFAGNVELALSAYNAGPERVQQAGNRIPNITETRLYVKKVTRMYTTYVDKMGG